MKVNDYIKVIQETPLYVPIFKLNRAPEWLLDLPGITKDTLFCYGAHVGLVRFELTESGRLKSSCSYGIGASYLEFVGYRDVK